MERPTPRPSSARPRGAESSAASIPELRRDAVVTLDLVIPFLDEEAVLPALLAELRRVFTHETCEFHGLARVRCVFVDDGSRDGSVGLLRDAQKEEGPLTIEVVRLSRNFGHQAAVTAGLAHSSAQLVAVLDADLQDPPACVLEMVRAWREGADVVHAQRRNRQEGLALRVGYAAFYRVYRLLSSIEVPADCGDFCLMSRRVVDELNRLPEKVRFNRALRSWVGFTQVVVPYDRPARAGGESRYGWWDLYRLATDGIASLSLRPLQLAQFLSIAFLFLSLLLLAAAFFRVFAGLPLELRLDLLLLVIVGSNAVVLFCLYLLGSYVGRAYLEVKGRPTYVVAEVFGAGDEER